jgi:hypothetical protein
MVEIRVAVNDPTFVHGLMRRLGALFHPSSVSYDGVRKEVRVHAEWESRAVVGVVEAVQGWLGEANVGSAEIVVGDLSYTLVAPA